MLFGNVAEAAQMTLGQVSFAIIWYSPLINLRRYAK